MLEGSSKNCHFDRQHIRKTTMLYENTHSQLSSMWVFRCALEMIRCHPVNRYLEGKPHDLVGAHPRPKTFPSDEHYRFQGIFAQHQIDESVALIGGHVIVGYQSHPPTGLRFEAATTVISATRRTPCRKREHFSGLHSWGRRGR